MSESTEDTFDVVVVGAGISGLVAARELVAAGVSVAVVEGRDRVGGRLLSFVAEGRVGLDLGATWFWPNEPNVVALIDELDVEVFGQYIDGDAMYHQPEGSQRVDGNPLDVPSGRFVAGADALAQAIATQLPPGTIRLSETVESIDASAEVVHVATASAAYRALHVILAVPPALVVSAIEFTPPLDDRVGGLASVTPVWMGAITKVIVQYTSAFWRSRGLAGSAISRFGPMREIHDMSGPDGEPAALFGFVPSTGEPTVTIHEITAQLVEIFGVQAANPVSVMVQDWRTEPLTSPVNVEQLTAYQTFGHDLYHQPAMGGRLHWSSTETSIEAPGHIEGAIVAARRAATAVLNDLTPLRASLISPSKEHPS